MVGVPTEEDGSGVVVFRAPRSRMAPHRLTQSKDCYVRRADRCEVMTMRLLFYAELREHGIPWSRVHVWREEKAGRFPKRVKIGANSVGWIATEIDEYVLAKVADRDAAIKAEAENTTKQRRGGRNERPAA